LNCPGTHWIGVPRLLNTNNERPDAAVGGVTALGANPRTSA
jgi:hypothetical protein